VSRHAGVLTEARELCAGWAVHTVANRQRYLLTGVHAEMGKLT